mgnify:CR=1 FL=1
MYAIVFIFITSHIVASASHQLLLILISDPIRRDRNPNMINNRLLTMLVIDFSCVLCEPPYLYCVYTGCIMEQVLNIVQVISLIETAQLQSASHTQVEITIEQLLTTTLNQLAEMRKTNITL